MPEMKRILKCRNLFDSGDEPTINVDIKTIQITSVMQPELLFNWTCPHHGGTVTAKEVSTSDSSSVSYMHYLPSLVFSFVLGTVSLWTSDNAQHVYVSLVNNNGLAERWKYAFVVKAHIGTV